jgi:type IV secretion system protein VirB10
LIIDFGESATPGIGGAKSPGAVEGSRSADSAQNADEQFVARAEAARVDRSRAVMLRNTGSTIAQGTVIPAILETALDSDLPGFTRAVVSRDVLSFDGRRVLVPRGSRVVGQYRNAQALGASRAFVIWTRILRSDGASIQIGSSGADELGRAGLAGRVDRHFLERFGGSILLSVVNAGLTAAAGAPSAQVVISSPQDANSVASSASSGSSNNISPTIRVPQGTAIRIFVARDLDFSSVEPMQP